MSEAIAKIAKKAASTGLGELRELVPYSVGQHIPYELSYEDLPLGKLEDLAFAVAQHAHELLDLITYVQGSLRVARQHTPIEPAVTEPEAAQ